MFPVSSVFKFTTILSFAHVFPLPSDKRNVPKTTFRQVRWKRGIPTYFPVECRAQLWTPGPLTLTKRVDVLVVAFAAPRRYILKVSRAFINHHENKSKVREKI